MLLSRVSEIIQARPNRATLPDIEVGRLLTDSRSLSFPSETLFFALRTARNDGHKYIESLYRQHVRLFVISEELPAFASMKEAVFLKVDDTLKALQQLAVAHRKAFDIPVIGITGSNGKTIVKEWLYQLLHADFNIVRSPRSYNSQIGVPLSVWGLSAATQLAIFEAGISKPGEMEHLQAIIRPEIGIFCNLGAAHQENFADMEQKCREKLKLFSECEVLIYCSDNKTVDSCVRAAKMPCKLVSWGRSEGAELRVLASTPGIASTKLVLSDKNGQFCLELPVSDEASIENILHCVAFMLHRGYSRDVIGQRIAGLESVAMRLELKNAMHNCLLINDSYNSDINSFEIALNFLERQSELRNLPPSLILSDMFQTGQDPEQLYKTVAQLAAEKNLKRFVGIGPQISAYAHLFDSQESFFFPATEAFLQSHLLRDFRDEVLLLKGSRSFHFEDISERLELINHQTTLEVNMNALLDNLNYFRSKLHRNTKMMCMVKAFAYGSGSGEVARLLQEHQADYLAVAVADEGAELRREGIRLPIVVMNPEASSFGEIFEYALEPEIYSFRLLDSFIAAAEKLGITGYPIHVKIDTGMHRLGFEPQDIHRLIHRLRNQQEVKPISVFSHLAAADEEGLDDFTRSQLEIFDRCSQEIVSAFPHRILRHVLNSAGIERFPDYQYDMVRLGIGHYGLSSIPGRRLKSVCSLKTVILQIKDLKKGESVGYNRKSFLRKDSRVAVIPVGYADGFDRRLGNGRGEVFVNGHRVPTIGNVCMDLCMIDLGDIEASEGDSVEIFGDNISISEVAEHIGTISYEVLTGISRRVKRVYYQE